jgi:hypothetical protein
MHAFALQGLDEIDARIGPKSDSSKGTGSQRTSNLKPVHKVKYYPVSHLYAYSFLFLLRSWNFRIKIPPLLFFSVTKLKQADNSVLLWDNAPFSINCEEISESWLVISDCYISVCTPDTSKGFKVWNICFAFHFSIFRIWKLWSFPADKLDSLLYGIFLDLFRYWYMLNLSLHNLQTHWCTHAWIIISWQLWSVFCGLD